MNMKCNINFDLLNLSNEIAFNFDYNYNFLNMNANCQMKYEFVI